MFLKITTFAIAMLLGLSYQKLNYDETRGLKAVHYTGATYCSYETLDSWSCGTPCSYVPDVSTVQRIFNSSDNTFAFVTYNSADDEIVLSFRGSNGADFENWATNLDFFQINYTDVSGARVHEGFNQAYEGVADEIRSAISTMIAAHPHSALMITGHSLGAALATLAALDIKRQLKPSNTIHLYTFGSPRIGNDGLSDYVLSLFPEYNRITHYDDMVAHSPASVTGFKHTGNEIWYYEPGTNMTYMECQNSVAVHENDKCSNSLWLKTGIEAHLTYLGYELSRSCTTAQPSGTLMQEEIQFRTKDTLMIQNKLKVAQFEQSLEKPLQ